MSKTGTNGGEKRNTFRPTMFRPTTFRPTEKKLADSDFPPLTSTPVAPPVTSDITWLHLVSKHLPPSEKKTESVIQEKEKEKEKAIPQQQPFDLVAWYDRMHKEVGYEEDDHLDYFLEYDADY